MEKAVFSIPENHEENFRKKAGNQLLPGIRENLLSSGFAAKSLFLCVITENRSFEFKGLRNFIMIGDPLIFLF